MEVTGTVKVLTEPKNKVDHAGHDYTLQIMVLEAQDGDALARFACKLLDEVQLAVQQQGISVGDQVVADLRFDTFTSVKSDYIGNKISIAGIRRA